MANEFGYAQALFEIAVESKKVKTYHKDARAIIEALKAEPQFVVIMTSTQLEKSKRTKIIKDSFSKKVNTNIINAMMLMVDNNSFNKALGNFEKLNKMFNTKLGIAQGIVTTTEPMQKPKISKLEKVMGKKLNKTVELKNILDQQIIGGIKVEVEGKIFDQTVVGQLDDMKTQILKGAN